MIVFSCPNHFVSIGRTSNPCLGSCHCKAVCLTCYDTLNRTICCKCGIIKYLFIRIGSDCYWLRCNLICSCNCSSIISNTSDCYCDSSCYICTVIFVIAYCIVRIFYKCFTFYVFYSWLPCLILTIVWNICWSANFNTLVTRVLWIRVRYDTLWCNY